MGKAKYEAELKLKIVEDCLNGRDNPNHVMNSTGIHKKTIQIWISKYKAEGPAAFLASEKNRRYTSDLKRKAVEEYLSGKASYIDLMEKYAIRSATQIGD